VEKDRRALLGCEDFGFVRNDVKDGVVSERVVDEGDIDGCW
jgi:hypothetical protein